MSYIKIYGFEVESIPFYIIWRPSGCLLKMIEFAGTESEKHKTVKDLYDLLYDYSGDYVLSFDDAVRKAPLIAEQYIGEMKFVEAMIMEQLSNNRPQNTII